MEELLTLPIHAQSTLLHEKKITAGRLVRTHLDAIQRHNDRLHAFTTVFYDEAEAAAHEADAHLQAGSAGPLCGIPLAVKDIIDIAGHVTSLGSASSAAYKAHTDAIIVRRLEAAGMISLGKVHTVEFAYGAWGTNEFKGTPRNPRSATQHFVSGGSSSGSAVAVAGNLASGALGTDTGGSVRIPSAFCGLVGLRPTIGRIPTNGVHPLSPSMDTIGPMTRCVQDTALMFDAMTGAEPTLIHPDKTFLKGLKVGVLAERERALVHADVLENYDASLRELESAGAITQPLSLPFALPELASVTTRLMSAEGYPPLRHIIDNTIEPVDTEVRKRFFEARNFTPHDYLQVLLLQDTIRRRFEEALKDVDIFVTPTTIGTAVPVADVDNTEWTPAMFTRFVSLIGRPALALPNGDGNDAMPTSLQLIGRPQSEYFLLRVALGLEKPQAQ